MAVMEMVGSPIPYQAERALTNMAERSTPSKRETALLKALQDGKIK